MYKLFSHQFMHVIIISKVKAPVPRLWFMHFFSWRRSKFAETQAETSQRMRRRRPLLLALA